MRAYPSHPNDERGHLSHWSQTPRAKTPTENELDYKRSPAACPVIFSSFNDIRTARNSGSPAQPPRAPVRHASVVKHTREKQSERKSAACSERARSLPVGRELEIGQSVPIGAKHQGPKHPFGLPQDSPAQPTCAAVRHAPGVEHVRKKQIERKSAVCSHRPQALPVGQELDIGPFPLLRHSMWQSVIKRTPCVECDRKKRNKRKSDAIGKPFGPRLYTTTTARSTIGPKSLTASHLRQLPFQRVHATLS